MGTLAAPWRGRSHVTLDTTAANTTETGSWVCTGHKSMFTRECVPFTGVSWTPLKLTWVDRCDNCKFCATRLETRDMEAPESNNALATICLPPSPFTRT